MTNLFAAFQRPSTKIASWLASFVQKVRSSGSRSLVAWKNSNSYFLDALPLPLTCAKIGP